MFSGGGGICLARGHSLGKTFLGTGEQTCYRLFEENYEQLFHFIWVNSLLSNYTYSNNHQKVKLRPGHFFASSAAKSEMCTEGLS